MNTSLIARSISNLQPRQIREKLFSDDVFNKQFELVASPVIILGGGDLSIGQVILISVIKKSYQENKEIEFLDSNGNEVFLKIEDNNIIWLSTSLK